MFDAARWLAVIFSEESRDDDCTGTWPRKKCLNANQALMYWLGESLIWKEYIDREDIYQEGSHWIVQACCGFDAAKGFSLPPSR